jgi:hypothetical protein
MPAWPVFLTALQHRCSTVVHGRNSRIPQSPPGTPESHGKVPVGRGRRTNSRDQVVSLGRQPANDVAGGIVGVGHEAPQLSPSIPGSGGPVREPQHSGNPFPRYGSSHAIRSRGLSQVIEPAKFRWGYVGSSEVWVECLIISGEASIPMTTAVGRSSLRREHSVPGTAAGVQNYVRARQIGSGAKFLNEQKVVGVFGVIARRNIAPCRFARDRTDINCAAGHSMSPGWVST